MDGLKTWQLKECTGSLKTPSTPHKEQEEKDMMTWDNNKDQYLYEIDHDDNYKGQTIASFKTWLQDNGMEDTFTEMLQHPALYDDYDIAVDFCLPLTMVRYFRKTA